MTKRAMLIVYETFLVVAELISWGYLFWYDHKVAIPVFFIVWGINFRARIGK